MVPHGNQVGRRLAALREEYEKKASPKF